MIVVVAMCFVFKSRSAGLAVRALFGFICVCLELGLRRVGKQGIMRVPPPRRAPEARQDCVWC